MRIFGVILAGGTARRMGGADKALMILGGMTLLERVISRLAPQVEALALSANGAPERFERFGLSVLGDDPALGSKGPLSGILAALAWAQRAGATHVVSAAVDTPFFPCDLVPQLCLAAERSTTGLAIARSGGREHPTFGLWPVALHAALAHFLRDAPSARVTDFVGRYGAATAEFPDPSAFANLNTPQDLADADARLAVD